MAKPKLDTPKKINLSVYQQQISNSFPSIDREQGILHGQGYPIKYTVKYTLSFICCVTTLDMGARLLKIPVLYEKV